MSSNATPPEADSPPTDAPRRGRSPWKWVVGLVVLAVVIWQVAHGVFVKSVSVPGGGSVAFYPKEQQGAANNGNIVRQAGSQNRSQVHGRENSVYQNGVGNQSTIN